VAGRCWSPSRRSTDDRETSIWGRCLPMRSTGCVRHPAPRRRQQHQLLPPGQKLLDFACRHPIVLGTRAHHLPSCRPTSA
jgi:hypothetical protein